MAIEIIITTLLCALTFALFLWSVNASGECQQWDPGAVALGMLLAFVAGCALTGTAIAYNNQISTSQDPTADFIYQSARTIGQAHGVSAERR